MINKTDLSSLGRSIDNNLKSAFGHKLNIKNDIDYREIFTPGYRG